MVLFGSLDLFVMVMIMYIYMLVILLLVVGGMIFFDACVYKMIYDGC